MSKITKFVATTILIACLAGCSSFNIDKERAAEKRKQDLCAEIDTRDLPHCTGN